jgi:DNA-binding response OmpR family regulator
VRALVRRSRLTLLQTEREPPPISVGTLWIDQRARSAAIDGRPLSLTAVEYDLLVALSRTPGWVKSREQLLLDVADRDFESFDRSIDVHISALRRKLGDNPKSPTFIETVRGVGYRLQRPGAEPSA